MSEKVLVFSEEIFIEIGEFKGFSKDTARFLTSERWLESLHYVDRAWAESTERVKQVISYDLIEQESKIFVYQRTSKGGEDRLHSKYSLGVGGHSNPSSIGLGLGFSHAIMFELERWRELREEIGLEETYPSELIGCIYDGSNAVGRVHWGLCHKVILPPNIEIKCTDEALAKGAFWEIDVIKHHKDWFENWSQLIIAEVLCKP